MRKAFLFLLTTAVIFITCWFSSDILTKKKLESASSNWPLLKDNLATISAKYTKRDSNDIALELQRLYYEIEYAPGNTTIDRALRGSVHQYAYQQLKGTGEELRLPSKEIRRFVYHNDIVFDAIEELLLASKLPVFAFNPTPNLYEADYRDDYAIQTADMLIAKSLIHTIQGRGREAWKTVHAVTRIADSLFSTPDLISQLWGYRITRDIFSIMRVLPSPAPAWAFKWPEANLKEGLIVASSLEANNFLRAPDEIKIIPYLEMTNTMLTDFGGKPVEITLPTKIAALVAEKQVLRMYAYYQISAMKYKISARMDESLCSVEPKEVDHIETMLPSWVKSSAVYKIYSIVDSYKTDSFDYDWLRIHFLKIQETGTKQVLAIKNGIRLQNTCTALSWSIKAGSPGQTKLSYDKPFPVGYDSYMNDRDRYMFTINETDYLQ